MKFAVKRGHAALLFSLFLAVFSVQGQDAPKPGPFDGAWQMDASKSHVNDGRVVELLTIQTVADGIKFSMKTKKASGEEVVLEFLGKTNGDASEVVEGAHKSKLMVWYNGPTLNASKENGPPDDVTCMWKFELSPDKQTATWKINHYEPTANDETLVFAKKGA